LIIFAFSLEEERESSQAARRANHLLDMSPYLTFWFKGKGKASHPFGISVFLPP
jgi:hypothetical protein